MTNLIVMRENAQKAANLLKAISHESRLMILCLLTQGELSVSELAEYSNLSQSAFSQHLSVLRKEKLVTTRKESQTVYYQLKDPNVKKIIDTLYEIYCK
ncbi:MULTISPECIES: ArsR/SmtB family transcription factor [Cysteiniphilum]|uniref:ArsR/SmtB family transcription factor n=1 Tax=Cysteiniphilum TaxID=2056696 RepID=UPI00178197B8|nr:MULTISPECIES: metalloregulator ArsR/SmtB family transcription factor [Cysteiniphilum]